MSKKWYEKRTPEEQQAIADFNKANADYWYGDYDLGGYGYLDTPKNESATDEDIERQTGLALPKASDDMYADYRAGGKWRGYQAYVPAVLDYRYIEQMANALASKHSVTVKVGDGWKINLEEKELTYNPMTLMTGSKARMIASLLHEIGHLRHTTPVSQMQTNQQYGQSGHEILNLYEDFRVDEIMADSYSGAGSVYEANRPVIEKIAEGYQETEKAYRESLVSFLRNYENQLVPSVGTTVSRSIGGWAFGTIADMQIRNDALMLDEKEKHKNASAMPKGNPVEKRMRTNALSMATRHMNSIKKDMERIGQSFDAVYDELGLVGKDRTKTMARKKIKDAIKVAERGETIFGFESIVICEAYGATTQGVIAKGMRERVEKCRPAIEKVRNAGSTQEVVDILNVDVYPHIRDLLLNLQQGSNMEQSIGKQLAKKATEHAQTNATGRNVGKPTSRETQSKGSKNSGTGAQIPSEWAKGNYIALKASVQTAINDLVQRLRFMRASDNSAKFESNLKRGKLHGKHLYRLTTGDDRLFRKKTEQKDRIGQVGVSVIIDKSGSMYGGSNMIHTIRGAIILAETCKELDIPLEIMTFSDTNHTLKKHDEPYTKDAQERLAGVVRAEGGSSNLFCSLEETQINKLQKRNKVAIILSDGGVGRGNYQNNKRYSEYFDEMRRANVVPVGVGVKCGSEITRLVGAGESTDDAYELPAIFDRIMRGCVNKTIK